MHSLDQIKNDDALSAKMIKNIENEDQLFVFVQDLDKAATEQQRVAARDKMRQKIKEIVDGFLNERAERIEKLKARVVEEERKLKEDQGNRDQLVDKRVNQFLREFTREFVPDDGPDQNAPGQPSQPSQATPSGGAVTASPDAATKK
jgi:hypothetical protein